MATVEEYAIFATRSYPRTREIERIYQADG